MIYRLTLSFVVPGMELLMRVTGMEQLDMYLVFVMYRHLLIIHCY